MGQLLAIAAGGALGSLLRYWVSHGVHGALGRGFPYGTLTVNLLGSLLMGILFVIFIERLSSESVMRAFLMVGFLGAFTTFSTFSLETINLISQGELIKAVSNILISVVLCVGAAWVGILIGRQL